MRFDALDIAHQVITQLRALVAGIGTVDGELAVQRRPLWRIAARSADRTDAAPRAAAASGHVDAVAAAEALATLDGLRVRLLRLTS